MGLALFCLLLEAAAGDFFQTFPVLDKAQHAVYHAESVQIVGTSSADALEVHLPSGWKLLRLNGEATDTQALISVGVGDFHNSSCGPYKELAIAVPACEGQEVYLDCSSFMRCQEKLPSCTHTFMLQSYANTEAAVQNARSAGIAAELSSSFDFSVKKTGKSSQVAFAVFGSGKEELLRGEVEVFKGEDSGGSGRNRETTGHRLQLFAAEGGRHICAFPSGLEAAPARMVDDLHGGDFFRDIGFQPEGALHLPLLQVMRLPKWGASGSKRSNVGKPARLDKEQGMEGKASPLIAKKVEDPPASAPSAPVNFMDLVKDFNEGQERLPKAEGLSETELLQVHQVGTQSEDAHKELLAKVAARNPRASDVHTKSSHGILSDL